jgi:hypothetical protein
MRILLHGPLHILELREPWFLQDRNTAATRDKHLCAMQGPKRAGDFLTDFVVAPVFLPDTSLDRP